MKRNSQNILSGSLLAEDSRPHILGGQFSKPLGEKERTAEELDDTHEEKVRQAMVGVLKEITSLGASFENIPFKNTQELGTGAKELPNTNKATTHTIFAVPELVEKGSQADISPHLIPPTHAELSLSKPVPAVRIVELPSEPGCRSFFHTTCQRIPAIVPEIVPYEECRSVPAVECFFVLKTIDDIECSPRSYEEC